MQILTLFAVFYLGLCFPVENCELNDICQIDLPGFHHTGIAKADKNCSIVLKSWRLASRLRCGMGIFGPIVCCPFSIGESQKACESFGSRPRNNKPMLTDKVINGDDAESAEFPYFASIGHRHKVKLSFVCGGVLISKSELKFKILRC